MTSKKEIWEVDDGAVDMECYSAQDIKILWILRETNGSDFSFKEFLQNPKVYNKWKSTVGLVVKTSNSIIEGLDGVKGNKYPKDISMVMKKIAWINVKKTGGEARSNSNQLLHHAKENAEIIESQIRELSPDVVILAGTERLVSDRVKNEINDLTKKQTVVVRAYHTNQRTITHEKYIDHILDKVNQFLHERSQISRQ